MDMMHMLLIIVIFLALFWELTCHNIYRVLTRKYSVKKTLLISTLSFIISVALSIIAAAVSWDILSVLLTDSEPEAIRAVNLLVIIIITLGIYVYSRISYKENRATVIFVASLFSMSGMVICDILFNYLGFIFPSEYYGTEYFYIIYLLTTLLIGSIIAIIVRLSISKSIKELIIHTSEKLGSFILVSVVGLLTYILIVAYFDSVSVNELSPSPIFARAIFVIIFLTTYFLIIFGVKRSLKIMQINDELRLAKEIQAQILPSRNALDEIHGVEISAMIKPYSEIGSDFYDVFKIDDERSAFIIADVAGKGIPAALYMTEVKSQLKVNLRMDKMPDYILTKANIDEHKKKIKTSLYYGAVVSVFETKTGKFTYSCAGHLPPVLIRKGLLKEVEYSEEPEIGIADTIYPEYQINLEKDDVMFFYTDGIIDTESKNKEVYGKERLFNIISKETSPEKMISAVVDDLNLFSDYSENKDDLAMLVFRVL